MAITGLTICSDALTELQVLGAGDVLSPEDAAFAISKLARIFDNWNAERPAVYADQFVQYPLTPALNPHTIGPTGTFVVPQRPVSIEGATLVFTNATNQPQRQIKIRNAQWYLELATPSLPMDVPSDLYYEPDWPNGNLFFYGVPKTAYKVELWTRGLLTALSLTDPFSLPPGYQDAATLTLAEELVGAYPAPPTHQDLLRRARKARDRVFANNVDIPRLQTADSGLGRGGASGTYRTGWF